MASGLFVMSGGFFAIKDAHKEGIIAMAFGVFLLLLPVAHLKVEGSRNITIKPEETLDLYKIEIEGLDTTRYYKTVIK